MVKNLSINTKIADEDNSNEKQKTEIGPSLNGNIIETKVPEMKRVAAGLKNLGNTCFLNSTLQCLMHTVPLFNFLQSQSHENCKLNKFCMVCELKRLVKDCFSNIAPHIAPNGILQNLRAIASHMRWGRQEDAHEFLRYVIESINKSFPKLKSKATSDNKLTIAETIFQGDLESQIKCLHCQHISVKCDPFLDICIDVKNVPSVEVGLERFTAPETLQGGNAYMCSNCKKKVKARKMFRLGKLPQVFTVQLKRYSPFGGKVSSHVGFPEVLNLAPYMSKSSASQTSTEYELYAVLIHEGSSTCSGHYYCHVKGPNSKWFCMNDSFVSSINLQEVLRSQAYLLFYLRKQKNLDKSMNGTNEGQVHQNGLKIKLPESHVVKTMQPGLKPSVSLESLNHTCHNKQHLFNKSLQLQPSKDEDKFCLNSSSISPLKSPRKDLLKVPTSTHKSISDSEHSDSSGTNEIAQACSQKKSLTSKLNGKVSKVWFTSCWRVESPHEEDKKDEGLCDSGQFKSTSVWKVEHSCDDSRVSCVSSSPVQKHGLTNGFSCPTLEWDKKKDIIINENKDDKELEQELSIKKLTFGRPILTWNGEQSLLDSMGSREVKSNRKRKWDEMDEEIDRGKIKKFKKKHSKNIGNAFQLHADKCYSKNFENDPRNITLS